MNKLTEILESFFPYLLLGVGIALIIALLILFSYVFLWGLAIGAVIWAIALIKQHFFNKTTIIKSQGRIIEHEHKDHSDSAP